MKTRVLFLFFMGIICSGIAQVSSSDTATYVYCDVLTSSKVMSELQNTFEVNVFIDFGNGLICTPDKPMKDERTGSPINFSSGPDILNYLAKKKWELVSSHSFTSKGNWGFERLVTHYIMKKKKY